MIDTKEQITIINLSWAFFKKFFERKKIDDQYWHDANGIDGAKIEKEHPSKFARKLLDEIILELAMIKDFGKQAPEIKYYFNVFADCANLIKQADKGVMECSRIRLEMSQKYKDDVKLNLMQNFVSGMLEQTMEEVARLNPVEEGEEG